MLQEELFSQFQQHQISSNDHFPHFCACCARSWRESCHRRWKKKNYRPPSSHCPLNRHRYHHRQHRPWVQTETTLETSGEDVLFTLETSGEDVVFTLETSGEDVHVCRVSPRSFIFPGSLPLFRHGGCCRRGRLAPLLQVFNFQTTKLTKVHQRLEVPTVNLVEVEADDVVIFSFF